MFITFAPFSEAYFIDLAKLKSVAYPSRLATLSGNIVTFGEIEAFPRELFKLDAIISVTAVPCPLSSFG